MRMFRFLAPAALIGLALSIAPARAAEALPDALPFYLAQYPMPVSISPDGKLALYKTRHAHDFELLVQDLASHKTLYSQTSPHTQLVLAWKDDNRQIAFLSVGPDGKQFQLHLWDLPSNKVTAVDAPLTGDATIPLRWKPGSSTLAMFAGNVYGGKVLTVDLADPQHPKVAAIGAALPGSHFAWSPDGMSLAYVPAVAPHSLMLAPQGQGAPPPRPLLLVHAGGAVHDVMWSANGKQIAASAQGPHEEYSHLTIIDAATGALTALVRRPFDISSPFWLDSDHVLFEANQNGLHALGVMDTATNTSRGISDKGSHHILEATPDGQGVYDYITQLDAPPQIDVLHPLAGTAERVAASPPIPLPAITPQMATLTAKDGGPVPAYVWAPPASYHGPRAGLIWVHGGPDQQELPVWDARSQWLANQGITFITINYRGSRGYGAAFRKQVELEKESLDVLAARQFLLDKGIEGKNIILAGYSHGGTVAAKALAMQPDGFGYLVLISTILDIQQACPAAFHLRGVYGFHAEFDNFTAPEKAHQAFTACFGAPASGIQPHWQVFPDEGHNFHRTQTWATIDSTMAGLSKGMP